MWVFIPIIAQYPFDFSVSLAFVSLTNWSADQESHSSRHYRLVPKPQAVALGKTASLRHKLLGTGRGWKLVLPHPIHPVRTFPNVTVHLVAARS